MKTGIELITEERQEQIEKHGWDIRNDEDYSEEVTELLKSNVINADTVCKCAGRSESISYW